jgi:hypothetical protein
MQQIFEITRTGRKIISQILQNHSLEQLNKIPEGYSNNLIWNIGHIVVVHQMLVYKLSGLPMMVSDDLVEKYMKGTKPEQNATQEEVDEIKELLFETLDQTENDLKNMVFERYQEYPTSTGFVIKNAVDAMGFNYFHEGIHIGIMMGLKRFL